MESKTLFGLKTIAKHLSVSPRKVREYMESGMPHTRDKGGMFISDTDEMEAWFRKRMREKSVL